MKKKRDGHTYTRFYGKASSWMSQFASRGSVVRLISRLNSNGDINRHRVPAGPISQGGNGCLGPC